MTRTKSRYTDSIDKLVGRLAALSPEPVLLNRKQVGQPPSVVYVGPSVFRLFTCPVGCKACCVAMTLDLLPDEYSALPQELKDTVEWSERSVRVNGHLRTVVTHDQSEAPACPYLTVPRGQSLGCAMWPQMPVECAAAPQLHMYHLRETATTRLVKKPFGRAWRFAETPQCEFDEAEMARVRLAVRDDIRLLERYQRWADHLGIPVVIPELIETMKLLASGPTPPTAGTLAWTSEARWWHD